MRLIDADRLLSAKMKSKYYHLPNGDVAIPIIDIEHAPTISGWISVKDRLPRDQDTVIVAINDDSGDTPYKYAYFGWYMSEAKCWIVDDEIRRGEVYAWMPLPEPPKEEHDAPTD